MDTSFFANFNWNMIIIVLAFILLDFITGISQAIANRKVNSTKLRQGLFHDCGFILAVALGLLCDIASQHIDLGFEVPICAIVCAYICLTEIISIIENLCKLAPELRNSKFIKLFSNLIDKE